MKQTHTKILKCFINLFSTVVRNLSFSFLHTWQWFKFLKISIFLLRNKVLSKKHHQLKLKAGDSFWPKSTRKNSAPKNCSKNLFRTFARCTHVIFALKLWKRFWGFKGYQNIAVCRLGWVTKKLFTQTIANTIFETMSKNQAKLDRISAVC